jgi:hypothetical protein
MEVDREYGLTYIKSRNYVALKFLELAYSWSKREVIFCKDKTVSGKWVLIVKDAI